MIKTFATISGVRPDKAKGILEQALSRECTGEFEVELQCVVSSGATFVIFASPTDKDTLARLFGEFNLMGCPPVSEAATIFQSECFAQQGWESGGRPTEFNKPP